MRSGHETTLILNGEELTLIVMTALLALPDLESVLPAHAIHLPCSTKSIDKQFMTQR